MRELCLGIDKQKEPGVGPMLKKHWLGLEEQLWSVFFQHWTRVAVFIFAKQDQLFVFEYCFNFFNNDNLTSLRTEFKVQLVRVTSELKINGNFMSGI